MRKHSLATIQLEMKELKKATMPEMFCIAFLDTTDDPNTFELRQNVHISKGKAAKIQSYFQRLSTPELKELVSGDISASRFNEIMSALKIFPDGCDPDKSILFTMDFGEMECLHEEL